MDKESFLEPLNEGLDPKIFARITEFCRADFFSDRMGIRITELAPGRAYMELDPEALHANMSGFLHGGVTVTMADLSMGIACLTKGFAAITSNINISYLSVGEIDQRITAAGQVIHFAKNIMYAESQIKNCQDKVLAKATGVFSVRSLITADIFIEN